VSSNGLTIAGISFIVVAIGLLVFWEYLLAGLALLTGVYLLRTAGRVGPAGPAANDHP
jgi:hypothetical protein